MEGEKGSTSKSCQGLPPAAAYPRHQMSAQQQIRTDTPKALTGSHIENEDCKLEEPVKGGDNETTAQQQKNCEADDTIKALADTISKLENSLRDDKSRWELLHRDMMLEMKTIMRNIAYMDSEMKWVKQDCQRLENNYTDVCLETEAKRKSMKELVTKVTGDEFTESPGTDLYNRYVELKTAESASELLSHVTSQRKRMEKLEMLIRYKQERFIKRDKMFTAASRIYKSAYITNLLSSTSDINTRLQELNERMNDSRTNTRESDRVSSNNSSLSTIITRVAAANSTGAQASHRQTAINTSDTNREDGNMGISPPPTLFTDQGERMREDLEIPDENEFVLQMELDDDDEFSGLPDEFLSSYL